MKDVQKDGGMRKTAVTSINTIVGNRSVIAEYREYNENKPIGFWLFILLSLKEF